MLPKLTDKDAQKVKEIDVSVSNKWKFKWLDCKVNILQGTNRDDVRVGECFDKILLAGQAQCRLYKKVTNYMSKGLVSLNEHIKSSKHMKLHFKSKGSYKVNDFKCHFMLLLGNKHVDTVVVLSHF